MQSKVIERQILVSNFSDEEVGENVNEAIEPDKKIEDIKQEPYNLPDGFKWDTLDLTNEDVVSWWHLFIQLFHH